MYKTFFNLSLEWVFELIINWVKKNGGRLVGVEKIVGRGRLRDLLWADECEKLIVIFWFRDLIIWILSRMEIIFNKKKFFF